MGRIAAEWVSEQIWEERCCHGFDGIGHAIAGEHTFQCYGSEGLFFYTIELREGWVGLDFRNFFFYGRRIIIMDEDEIRIACQHFFVANGDPLLVVEVIKNVFTTGLLNQQRFKVTAGAGEHTIVSAVINQ